MVRTIKHTGADGKPYWEVTAGGQTVTVYRKYSAEAGRTLYFPRGARAGFATLSEVVEWLEA